ncbi:hypothetical protein B0T16DRAFT_452639 [Cercophora newfieldiana]|uniref:Uncharacterized protein n=1 Tax=Cercophora newfieldiana TaxID=92897 RepID=A0AA39YR65_9PEZI|nr:hypothetical protein B0T16DRAFT_452639 [Cercophora newfieldiana]
MASAFETACDSLDVFLTLTKAEHFLLYAPYDGHSMLEFLDSCFHRDFMRHVAARGFKEIAVFTERAWLGRMFVLLSRHHGRIEFGLENSRALQEAGVFSQAFSMARMGLLPAYAVESNTLLVQHEGFYQPQRLAGRPGADIDITGAQTLLIYAGLKDGIYDIRKQLFLGEPVPHKCESMRWACSGRLDCDAAPLEWGDLFGPPWDKPYTGIYRMSPYMALNILTSELGPLIERVATSGRQSVPLPDPQPAASSQTMENADKIIRRARQSIHEFSLLKRSFSPRLQHHHKLSGQAEDRSPSTDQHRSSDTTHRSSPLPAFQDSARPPPSMDVTQMLLDELRKAKPDGSASTTLFAKPVDVAKPQDSSLGTGLLQTLTARGYEVPTSGAAESESDTSESEDGARPRSMRLTGKPISDAKEPRENVDLITDNGSGSNSLAALDPSTLDQLVRKLEAVKGFQAPDATPQGANSGSLSGKSRRRRKKRQQVAGGQEPELDVGADGVAGTADCQ